MSTPYIIPTRFTAIDGISPVVRKMNGSLGDMAAHLNATVARQERLFRKLTPGLGAATKQILSYGSAGAVLAGLGGTGKAIMQNETAMQSLSAVTGVVGDEFTRMRREANELAIETRQLSTDMAGSFETVGSMMSQYLSDPKSLRMITKEGVTLAKASRMELVPSLEYLTTTMNQFNLAANQAARTVNILTAGEVVGSLRTQQVTESLQEFGAGAYAANISLTESVALVEALAKQMKTDKIGVGARNILTVMDSATGLAKKARKELRAAGVDMGFLMDKTKSLSERLHELSKVSGNEKAITKIFGRENKTAAQVIFNQLGVFDEYVRKIAVTNQAELQAATNSQTFANSVKELKAAWINYFVVDDRARAGLNLGSEAMRFVARNMGTIIDTAMTAIKVFAIWKGAIIAAKVVTTGFNIALGIQNALYATSVGLLEGNIVAQNAAIISKRALGVATQMLAGDFTALNAVMAANPALLVFGGVMALAGGLYLIHRREQQLLELYKEKMRLDTVNNIRKEAAEVDNLAKKYFMLGNSIQKSNAMAIIEKKVKTDTERKKVEANISSLKAQYDAEMNKIYAGDFFMDGGYAMYGKRSDLGNQLAAEQAKARGLAEDNSYITQYAKAGIDAGLVNPADLGGLFKNNKTPGKQNATGLPYMQGDKEAGKDFLNYEKLRELFYNKQQKILVEFKNAPDGMQVSSSAGLSTSSSY